jgi:hypothetical protein
VIEPMRVLDSIRRVSPLGVMFVDPLNGRAVGDGLSVSAFPEGLPSLRRQAVMNRSGVHAFHDLPGLLEFRFPDRGGAASGSLPQKMFRVEVRDDLERFLPFAFDALLPFQGLFELDVPGSASSSFSGPAPRGIELFSAPARQLPRSFARVYLELFDPDPARNGPAVHALVELRAEGGVLARGLSDEQGRVTIFLPYPEPVDVPGATSSAFPHSPALLDQSWTIEIAVFYTPILPVPRLPDLRRVLAQSRATAWADVGRTVPLESARLQFAHELTVQTQGAIGLLSNLWVTAA